MVPEILTSDDRGVCCEDLRLTDKLNRLLLYIYRKTGYLSEAVLLPIKPAIAYAKHESELGGCVESLSWLVYVEDDLDVHGTKGGCLALSGQRLWSINRLIPRRPS